MNYIRKGLVSILALMAFYQSPIAQNLRSLSYTVVYLNQSGRIGTGFFVSDNSSGYLITAKHVAQTTTPECIGTIGDSKDSPHSFKLSTLVIDSTSLNWIYHEEADVAVLPLTNVANAYNLLTGRFLSIEMCSSTLSAPQRERPLVVMGFPLALGTRLHFSAITSEAKAASGLVRIKPYASQPEQTLFLLDKPSIGGFSGSPVFLMPWPFSDSPALTMPDIGTKVECVGVVSGTISDDTGGKLAIIVPIFFALELIRKNRIAAPLK